VFCVSSQDIVMTEEFRMTIEPYVFTDERESVVEVEEDVAVPSIENDSGAFDGLFATVSVLEGAGFRRGVSTLGVFDAFSEVLEAVFGVGHTNSFLYLNLSVRLKSPQRLNVESS